MKRDETLVQEALDGSPTAFNVLVERYHKRLTRFLIQRVGNPHDAEELTQEVFLRTYLALNRFDPAYRFSTWLYRIAINLGIDFLRKKHVVHSAINPDHPDPVSDPHRTFVDRESYGAFLDAMEALPENFRLLVEMRHFLDMSYQEMAETLGIPLGTVKNRLFRARKALSDKLE